MAAAAAVRFQGSPITNAAAAGAAAGGGGLLLRSSEGIET